MEEKTTGQPVEKAEVPKDISKQLSGLTTGILDKTKAGITEVKKGFTKEIDALKEVNKKVIDELNTKVISLQKSLDTAKKIAEEKGKPVEKKSIYTHKYGKIEEGSFAELFTKNLEKIRELRAGGESDRELHLGYYKTNYFEKAGLSGAFEYGSTSGNISREERVTRIADEGPNFQHRIINNLPTAPVTVPGNSVRYNYISYSENKDTAVTDRLSGDSLTARNTGPRQIGTFNDQENKYNILEADVKLGIIQTWLDVPMERLDDTAQLNTFLNGKLLGDHYDYLDNILLNHNGVGDINFKGLNALAFQYVAPATGTPAAKAASIRNAWVKEAGSLAGIYDEGSSHVNYLDVINVACGVLSDRNFMPTSIILNYKDCYGLKLLKTKVTANYLQAHEAKNPSPIMTWNGLTIIPRQQQAPGTFTLFDRNCLLVKVRDALRVATRVAGKENYLANTITVKIDQRLTMLAFESSGIIYGNFSYWINDIINVKDADSSKPNLGKWGNPDGVIRTKAV